MSPIRQSLHELNNCICGISGYVELSEGIDPDIRDKLEILFNRTSQILLNLSLEFKDKI